MPDARVARAVAFLHDESIFVPSVAAFVPPRKETSCLPGLAVPVGVVERDLAAAVAEAEPRVGEEDVAALGVGGRRASSKSDLLPPKPFVPMTAGTGRAVETPAGV